MSTTSIAQAAETITYFHDDLLGLPAAATDESGEIIWRENYQAFGEKVKNQDEKTDNVIGYTGHVHDDIGLTYMQARYYDPVIGRFYANDPVGFVQSNPLSFNRYAYANNNPYKFVDPDGNFAFLAIPAYTLAEYAVVAILGAIVAKGIEEEIVTPAIQAHMNKDEQSEEGDAEDEVEPTEDGNPDGIREEYDSLEAAVGSVNPLDEVEYEGKTKDPGLKEQGYTEKWTGVDSDGEYQSAFRNPKTDKWTGGHRSSMNDKYW